MHPLAVSLLVAAATWDAWRWLLGRVADAPEEVGALVMAVLFLGAVGFVRRREPNVAPSFLPVAAMLALYAGCYAVLPPIGRAAVAVAATLFAFHLAAFRHRPPPAFWGLVALAMPVLPSLQFTFGYPLRVVSAELAVLLLQAHGLAVTRDGTFLAWRGELIQFDAPCSGINMLWAALLLTLMASIILRFDLPRLAAGLVIALVATVAANVLRAASLFYLETGAIPSVPAWWHEGTGVAAFVLAAVAILLFLRRLSAWRAIPCKP